MFILSLLVQLYSYAQAVQKQTKTPPHSSSFTFLFVYYLASYYHLPLSMEVVYLFNKDFISLKPAPLPIYGTNAVELSSIY